MNIVWTIKRLRTMGVSEVLFRVHRLILLKVESLLISFGWIPRTKNTITSRGGLFSGDAALNEEMPVFNCQKLPGLEEYIDGNIYDFGNKLLEIGLPVDWHHDPVMNVKAPLSFGKNINYRNSKIVGNVKVLWELGRHQHLIPMAMEYAKTGDLRYKNAVIDQIEGWIEQNPYGRGIHWCSSLEVSLRLISWSVVHSFFCLRDKDDGLLSSIKDSDEFRNIIYQKCYFVRNYLSRYSSANNHLIGELSGLWTACCVFDLGTKGEEWRAFSGQELYMQSQEQIYSDGVNKEQACYYHLEVLDYFLFTWLVGERYDFSFNRNYQDVIIKMYRYLKDIMPDDGEAPLIGDADDGYVVRFDTKRPGDPYSDILKAVEVIFDKSKTIQCNKAFWYRLMVKKTFESYATTKWQRKYPAEYLEGGYAILGNSSMHLVFDAGSLGYLGIAAHGHADALSFCLAVDNEWWFVDPGTYSYHTEAEWRDYFRGTFGHNTITINSENQSRISGSFMWQEKANAKLNTVSFKGSIQEASGSHDGYQRIGVVHSRQIKLCTESNVVTINDNLDCNMQSEVSIQFHFSPEIQLVNGPKPGSWLITRTGSKRQLLLQSEACFEWDVLYGERNPVAGWYSSSLGSKVSTKMLVGKTRTDKNMQFTSSISIV